ncbi:unnamed protein product [Protopolystoma xenopodis]|uniref:Uncharacterized protein n=1 Tax=Protopolystoma xenopodis TaxID=117903 RepID=A0A448XSG2_9PLAT|nr:unnamed protein product [Protopolystoma xenopodis]
MRLNDHLWTDPPATELLQRRRIYTGALKSVHPQVATFQPALRVCTESLTPDNHVDGSDAYSANSCRAPSFSLSAQLRLDETHRRDGSTSAGQSEGDTFTSSAGVDGARTDSLSTRLASSGPSALLDPQSNGEPDALADRRPTPTPTRSARLATALPGCGFVPTGWCGATKPSLLVGVPRSWGCWASLAFSYDELHSQSTLLGVMGRMIEVACPRFNSVELHSHEEFQLPTVDWIHSATF